MGTCRFLYLIVFFLSFVNLSNAKDCNPSQSATFSLSGAGYYNLTSKPAAFDPCNNSVIFKVHENKLSPLIIGVHGAGGRRDTEDLINFFFSKGFATLVFDAFDINGVTNYRKEILKYGNNTRQEMIYPVARGAVEWAIKQKGIDKSKIYIYGLSNGATVVANLAAIFNHQDIKLIISEAPTHAGMGMPDNPLVPLLLVFGKLDNYGSPKEDGWRWSYNGPCFLNIVLKEAPQGNTKECNKNANANLNGQSLIDWANHQKNNGNNITVWFYENAAHGIYTKDLDLKFRSHPTNNTGFYANEGAKPEVRKKYSEDLLNLLK